MNTFDTLAVAPNAERHIASFIVYVQPERMDSVIALLGQWPETEISHRDVTGKFVLVNESDSYDGLNRLMNHLHDQAGVLNVALVSHFVEDEAALRAPMASGAPVETSPAASSDFTVRHSTSSPVTDTNY